MINQAELLQELARKALDNGNLPDGWEAFGDSQVNGIQAFIDGAAVQLILSEDTPRFRWIREGDNFDQEGLRDEQKMIYSTLVYFMIQALLEDPGSVSETQ